MEISRRTFLAGLLSVGATVSLPVPLAQATPAQVDEAWEKLLREPWYFDVTTHGTIVEADAEEMPIRGDVFNVDVGVRCTPESLVQDVEGCTPLMIHFQRLAADKLEEIQAKLEDNDDDVSSSARKHLERLANVLEDPDDGWAAWVIAEDKSGLPRFVRIVEDWLSGEIDGDDVEWIPARSGAQGKAMTFFESLDNETQKALGVVIIEGEHPGSSYYAAELRQPIGVANTAAEGLALPFRFKLEGTNHG